jgi:hypothetical protein
MKQIGIKLPWEKRTLILAGRSSSGRRCGCTGLARTQRVGLHALLLALLAAEVRRRDGRSGMIIGSGISVRPPGADAAVGCFVNPLPIVLNASNATPLAAQIRSAQTSLTEAVEHALYPSGYFTGTFVSSIHSFARNLGRHCSTSP